MINSSIINNCFGGFTPSRRFDDFNRNIRRRLEQNERIRQERDALPGAIEEKTTEEHEAEGAAMEVEEAVQTEIAELYEEVYESVVPKLGRREELNEDEVEVFKNQARFRDQAKDSFTVDSFIGAVLAYRQEQARQNNRNVLAIHPISKETANKYLAIIAPEKVKSRQTQSEKRKEAMEKAVSHLSLAVMWAILYDSACEHPLNSARVFNFDSTHLMLNEWAAHIVGSLRLAMGSPQLLHELSLNPSTTTGSTPGAPKKRRSLGLTTSICSEGSVSCAIMVLRDARIAEVSVHRVSKLQYSVVFH